MGDTARALGLLWKPCLAAIEGAVAAAWRPPQEEVRQLSNDSWIAIQRSATRRLDASDSASAARLDRLVDSADLFQQIAAASALGKTGGLAAVERLADVRLKSAARCRWRWKVHPAARELEDPRGGLS